MARTPWGPRKIRRPLPRWWLVSQLTPWNPRSCPTHLQRLVHLKWTSNTHYIHKKRNISGLPIAHAMKKLTSPLAGTIHSCSPILLWFCIICMCQRSRLSCWMELTEERSKSDFFNHRTMRGWFSWWCTAPFVCEFYLITWFGASKESAQHRIILITNKVRACHFGYQVW